MPRANFDDDQFLATKGPFTATGPKGPGETLLWVWVWLVQNDGGNAAAARGGAAGPFSGTWRVPLNLGAPSDPFTPDKRARGHAVALVDDGSGQQEAYWWSERIWIRP